MTPFDGFRRSSMGLLAFFRGRSRSSRLTHVVEDTPGIFKLMTVTPGEPSSPPRIVGGLYAGRKRVHVIGSPGQTFRVRRVAVGGSAAFLSAPSTIPVCGQILVDLGTPLTGGETVRCTGGPRRSVVAATAPVLFPPFLQDANEGECIRLEGDGLTTNVVARYRLTLDETVAGPLTTEFKSEHQIDVVMPAMGDPSAEAPHTSGVLIDVWLADSASGARVSQRVTFTMRLTR